MEHLDMLLENDARLADRLASIERHTQEAIDNNTQRVEGIITIPTVVHVLYNTNAQNISDAQIESQMQVLNDDFRRLNADASSTPSAFVGVAADAEIEFCLASIDPDGNPTTGITRTYTSTSAFSTNDAMKFSSTGGIDAWPTGDYLNVWVCNMSGGILGYAQFPGGNASTDGVVNLTTATGTTGNVSSPFDGGRTLTHEVGHWLNLRHIWGDGGCSVDDFVSDTPTSDNPNYGCSTGHVSCSSTDMVQNYMDYSNDACMNLFTEGQKSRMRALFDAGGWRASLLTSNGCGGGGTPPTDGSGTDGSGTDGTPTDGAGTDGSGTDGTPTDGAGTDGSGTDGTPTDGSGTDGTGTTPPADDYCGSNGSDSSYEWIDEVSIGTMSNPSGNDNGYGDYTGTTISTEQGQELSAVLIPGFGADTYNEYWKIWIDYNQDLDFDDAGELVYDSGSASPAAVVGTFTIPSDATTGQTRLRVSMKWDDPQTACEAFQYGEVEDYTIQIDEYVAPPPPPPAEECTDPQDIWLSNVQDDRVTLQWEAVPDAIRYNIQYRPEGTSTWLKKGTKNTWKTLKFLSPSTTYEMRMRTRCPSGWTAYGDIYTFTTYASRLDGSTQITEAPAMELNVFPNPATNVVNIEYDSPVNAPVSIEVYDLTGRQLISKTSDLSGDDVSLDVSGLTPGCYLVTVSNGELKATKKLFVY